MERGSNKQNAKLDEQMKEEVEPLVRAGKESHVEDHLQKEDMERDLEEEE